MAAEEQVHIKTFLYPRDNMGFFIGKGGSNLEKLKARRTNVLISILRCDQLNEQEIPITLSNNNISDTISAKAEIQSDLNRKLKPKSSTRSKICYYGAPCYRKRCEFEHPQRRSSQSCSELQVQKKKEIETNLTATKFYCNHSQ